MKTAEIGKSGEDYCVEKLSARGYEILSRNFHSPWGEIDIIAKYQHYLVFIEVKTRTRDSIEHAQTSVTYSKQAKITKTAMYFLKDFCDSSIEEYRFDVMIVKKEKTGIAFRHIENAFLPVEVGDFFV